MMQWSRSEVIDELNSKIMAVSSKSDLIEVRGIGDASKAAVNTLIDAVQQSS